jgi:hypothetical protein
VTLQRVYAIPGIIACVRSRLWFLNEIPFGALQAALRPTTDLYSCTLPSAFDGNLDIAGLVFEPDSNC